MSNSGNHRNTPSGLRRSTKLLPWHNAGNKFVQGTLSSGWSSRHVSILATAGVGYAARRAVGIVLLVSATVIVFGGAGSVAFADSDDMTVLLRRAEGGDAHAAFTLGMRYARPDYSGRDVVEALRWLRRAAEQGLAEAQYNLGVLYDLGRGVTADAATAMGWYERAAARGYHPAASRLVALRAANPKLVAKPSMPSQSVATQAPPVAATGAAPPAASPAPSTMEAPQPSPPGPRSASAWLASLEPEHYTLQVLSHTNEESVRRYLAENFDDGEAGYFAFELDGKTWYTVVYGDYASHSQARTAGASLAGRLPGPEPWVRKVAVIQKAAIR